MLTLKEIKIEEIKNWNKLVEESSTATFFQTREWLQVWLKHFGGESIIYAVYERNEVVGIVPFIKREDKLELLGTSEVLDGQMVSDFGDVIAVGGREREVWQEIIAEIQNPCLAGKQAKSQVQIKSKIPAWPAGRQNPIIELNFIRENSPSFIILKELGGQAEEVDVAPYIDLPKTWEEYLSMLDRHDRHELRRKIRKLEEQEAFSVCPEGKMEDIDEFLRLMKLSSDKKMDFLSKKMENFFQDIFLVFSKTKQLKLCFLKLNNINIASVIIFTYKNEYLLYNSGYDPEYYKLSPGLLLKAFTIKQAIEEERKKFDFLRGNERYKYDLGGRLRRLYKFTFGSDLTN